MIQVLFVPILAVTTFTTLKLFHCNVIARIVLLLRYYPTTSVASIFTIRFRRSRRFTTNDITLAALLDVLFLPLYTLVVAVF